LTALERELREPLRFPSAGSVPHTLEAAMRHSAELERRWISDQGRSMRTMRHLERAAAALAVASTEMRLAQEQMDR
jgi:hypothetical protein